MDNVLEVRVKNEDKSDGNKWLVNPFFGGRDTKKDKPKYGGLKLVEDKEYMAGTSIKYWM